MTIYFSFNLKNIHYKYTDLEKYMNYKSKQKSMKKTSFYMSLISLESYNWYQIKIKNNFL